VSDTTPACAKCKKTGTSAIPVSLKTCAKCKTKLYCGRGCQEADWKNPKKVCSSAYTSTNGSREYVEENAIHTSSYSAPCLRTIENHVLNLFTRSDQGTYLQDCLEQDVYKLFIDSYHMREAHNVNFEHKTTPLSVYTGASSSIEPFRRYLAKTATRSNLLPPWWDTEKQKECEAFGESGVWTDLRRRVNKQQVIDRYGDSKMRMQVRMLAEAVYGSGSMGQDATPMRRAMTQMESGGPGNGQIMSILSI
jgi:splicing suppressor protein 51